MRSLEIVDRKPMVWWRYIDDVFVIWPHSKGCLEQYIHEINRMHPTIKYTDECSNKFVAFLDVKVILREGCIVMDLFTKPTDTHQYLHQKSCHSRHQKSTIPYSQALRIHHICSQECDYTKRTVELKNIWSIGDQTLHRSSQ